MNKIAAIVVTYNRKDMLAECIHHLLNLEGATCDILIIDNGSTDGTEEMLSGIHEERVICYSTGENLGGAGGFNYGLKQAAVRGYKYAWLMDDDTYVEPDSLTQMIRAHKQLKGRYGFLSGIALWKDGSICSMNRQYTSFTGKADHLDQPIVPVIMATFVSFFVPMRIVKKVGLPISDFFIWSDDLEYSRRISRIYPCYAVSASRVTHMIHSNQKQGIENDSEDRLWRYRYMYRNEVYVYRREGLKGILYLFARYALHSLRVIVHGTGNKRDKLSVINKSFWSGWRFHPKVEMLQDGITMADEE